jgi:hypothetical protein
MGDAVAEGSATVAAAAGTVALVAAVAATVAAAAAGSSAPAAAAAYFAGCLPPQNAFSSPVSTRRALFVRPPTDPLDDFGACDAHG